MKRLLVGLLLLLLVTPAWATELRVTAHITSQTTTVLVAAVAGKFVVIRAGSVCVDSNGADTGVALQSTAGANLVGTSVVYVIAAGQCLFLPRSSRLSDFYYTPSAIGTGFQIVTTVGNGPVEVYLEVAQ